MELNINDFLVPLSELLKMAEVAAEELEKREDN